MPAGEVSVIHNGNQCNVEWKLIPLWEDDGVCYWSPKFSFEGETWYMGMFPNDRENTHSSGYIRFRLWRRSSTGPPMNVEFSFAFKTLNGRKKFKRQTTGVFNSWSFHDVERLMRRSDFERRLSEFISSYGQLTVVCTLKRLQSAESANDISRPECSYCEKMFDIDEISLHEKKCRVKCPDCSDIVLYEKWRDHECQTSGVGGVEKLVEDLQGMLTHGYHSDVTIKVKGEEFRLHRNILGARSPYFYSMFSSNMREKNTGVVCINDCEPDVFRSFIHFLYTGKVENLSPENVCDLYEISDKYREDLLKEKCLQFMMNLLTVESFTNFILIALRHNEKELLKKAASIFANNTKEIICDVKWLNFMKEYPVYANELHIKSLDVHRGKS